MIKPYKKPLFVFWLICYIFLLPIMASSMEEEVLLNNNNEFDIEMGDAQSPLLMVHQKYLATEKKKKWRKTIAWGLGGLASMAGGTTCIVVSAQTSASIFLALGGSWLIAIGVGVCAGRAVFHEWANSKEDQIVQYTTRTAQKLNTQKLHIPENRMGDILMKIECNRLHPSGDIASQLEKYGLLKLLPHTHDIDSKLPLMAFLLSLKRTGFDQVIKKDIIYKIISYCPELIYNQQLFNTMMPYLKKESDYSAYIIHCPFDWFKTHYHTKCADKVKEKYVTNVASAGTDLYINTIYDFLPENDLNNPDTFGDLGKVHHSIYQSFTARIKRVEI